MKLLLSALESIEIDAYNNSCCDPDGSSAESKEYKVEYCGVCRTDAKMFYEGQRDLVFPRVMGHEVIVSDPDDGRMYNVWPGESCGKCEHCLTGRENLCEGIRIMGFHFDGGYSDSLSVRKENLIETGPFSDLSLATFAEPMGCLINLFGRLDPKTDSPVIIFGGGTLGLMAACYAGVSGLNTVIVEKDEEKIALIRQAAGYIGARVVKETNESDFATAVNTCADNIAFAQALSKIRKGGKLFYFSGVKKNKNITTNLLNLIHYRELQVFGSYGLSRNHMTEAIDFIRSNEDFFRLIVQDRIPLTDLTSVIPDVISGKPLKYIVDMGMTRKTTPQKMKDREQVPVDADLKMQISAGNSETVGKNIQSVSSEWIRKAEARMDDKAKPLGSFGMIEKLAVRIAAIRKDLNPDLKRRLMVVFGGDHGITEEGVSAYPQEVTKQMVETLLKGKAAINVLCENMGIDTLIVDMGVNHDFSESRRKGSLLINRKIGPGTRNMALEPAMTEAEAHKALRAGGEIFYSAHGNRAGKGPVDILGLGEVGIGNTTSAAAIISAVTGLEPALAAGRGTGVDNRGLKHKIETLEKVLAFQKPSGNDGIDVLRRVGGYEIGGMAGAALAAAEAGVPVVLDGIISTAAGLIAGLINPEVFHYFIAGHKSVEQGQKAALEYMGLEPVLDLGMRLGEGTGAAFTIGLCDNACAVMRNMATFDEAGIQVPVS